MTRNGFSIGRAAELVGCSPGTLRSYDRRGLVTPDRDELGHRIYSVADIDCAREVLARHRRTKVQAARAGMSRWLGAKR
jgi:DNA-binding transcriptional MerR regulator